MNEIIVTIIQVIIVVAAFLIGKYIPSANKTVDTTNAATTVINFVSEWAYKFVVSAKNRLKQSTGSEKFDFVKEQIIALCEANNISLSEEQIKATIETAYEQMVQATTQIILDTSNDISEEEK